MKFSIHKEDKKNKKLRSLIKVIRNRFSQFNPKWEGVLEISNHLDEDETIIMRIYDNSDPATALLNDGAPQEIVEGGFHMPWKTPTKHTDEFIAGWFFCKLWAFWEEEG